MGDELDELKFPEKSPLGEAEVRSLIARSQAGDMEARQQLVEHNLRLVMSIVNRFRGRGYEVEDLFQVGSIGLMKAIDGFDLDYGVRFSTYAVPRILGEIRAYLRSDRPVKVSRSIVDLSNRVRIARSSLTQELGRSPTSQELARELELPVEDVIMAMESTEEPVSLQDVIYEDEGQPVLLQDALSDDNDKPDRWVVNLALKQVLDRMPLRERRLLMMRFVQDKTQAETAEILGISQAQISRLEKKYLNMLREQLA